MQYRLKANLSYPTDPALITRLQAGEAVPWADRRMRRATPGEVVTDLPPDSVLWLLEQDLIEPAEEVADGEIRER